MAIDLTDLRARVARGNSVKASAAVMIRGFAQKLRDAITADDAADSVNINAVADEMDASTTDLANAVAENTPAASEPPAPAVEPPA